MATRWRGPEPADFTINAMAARLPSYELVDPFGGLAALKEKVLRTPDAQSSATTRCGSCARPGSRPSWFTVTAELHAAMTAQASKLKSSRQNASPAS